MKGFAVVLAGFLSFLQFASGQSSKVGSTAPDFSLRYATRDSIPQAPLHLADLIGGSPVVLAFYPADWSSGCTKEVCAIRDDFGSLSQLNAQILAISGDYVYSHHEWAIHHDLPFRLLSDHQHSVAKAYDSYNPESGMNRRTVFLIDKHGTIVYANLHYSVADDQDFKSLKQQLAQLK